jgi:RNA polymerase sigma factor (sigma-70 family)
LLVRHCYDGRRREKVTVTDTEWLAQRFEEQRPQLRAVAYRMLGSLSEAEDAVQEGWLRLARSDADAIDNLGAWLTTVVGRVCLDMLRSRRARREESLDIRVPDPIVASIDGALDPEQEAVLADSVGLALLVVLDTLSPAERLAFVLHDMFAVPFAEIAPIVGRSVDATKMLASRARTRIRGSAPMPDADLARQREVVNAYLAAAREGDFEGLVRMLDPDVVLRADGGETGFPSRYLRGAEAVASSAMSFRHLSAYGQAVLVNGGPGAIAIRDGEPLSLLGFTVVGDRIVEINILSDPERLRALDLTFLQA